MTLEHLDIIFAFVLIITGVSLLITALNQAASALLGLRGTQLRWAITTLLQNTDPRLKPHARDIAEQVLHHPLISDSTFSGFERKFLARWKLANGVRKGELVEILRLLAERPTQPGEAQPVWQARLKESLDQLDPQAADDIAQVVAAAQKLFPDDTARLQRLVTPMVDAAAALPGRIDQWFDAVMDRSSQRFALHMRIWTVIFAFVLAFGLQLDAFSLFNRLATDSQLRSQVIASADALNARAEDMIGSATNSLPAVLGLAMKQLVSAHPEVFPAAEVPSRFDTLAAAEAWLAAELKKHGNTEPPADWARRFESLVPQARAVAAVERLNSLVSDQLVLQLVPSPYPQPIYRDWDPSRRTFWGIVASAVLLSLGAPFWFHVLKDLSNLRPVLAKKTQPGATAEAQPEGQSDA